MAELTQFLQNLAFELRHTLDPAMLDLLSRAEETLPARNGVCSDEGTVLFY